MLPCLAGVLKLYDDSHVHVVSARAYQAAKGGELQWLDMPLVTVKSVFYKR